MYGGEQTPGLMLVYKITVCVPLQSIEIIRLGLHHNIWIESFVETCWVTLTHCLSLHLIKNHTIAYKPTARFSFEHFTSFSLDFTILSYIQYNQPPQKWMFSKTSLRLMLFINLITKINYSIFVQDTNKKTNQKWSKS